MKALLTTYLPTLLRHAFTALAGLGAFLATKGVIEPGDAAAVDASGASIATALVVILTAIIARIALMLLAKTKLSGVVPGSAKAAGWLLWLGMVSLAGLAVLALPGCATTVTRTTLPDGTVIEVTAKASDAVAIGAAVDVSRLILPIVIHPDK